MSFQLVIAEGKEAGREFVFEQRSVVIGRTSECDVVLYDTGVSRKHARIFFQENRYFVEDMGSSNGTKVNGSAVNRRELSDGDSLALGSVVFSFSEVEPSSGSQPEGEERSEEHTNKVSHPRPNRRRKGAAALAPADAGEEELNRISKSSTKSMQALRRNGASSLARPSEPALEGRKLSAAERARLRRESGALLGRFRIFWLEASLWVRRTLTGLAAAAALAVLGLVYYLIAIPGDGRPEAPPEPSVLPLSAAPIEQSFGLGPGVTYPRRDMKVFEFEYAAPVKAVMVLHFQSEEISQGEVMVSVNGADVGAVPADTRASQNISHEILIRPEHLKKGETNRLAFDNTRNPPHAESWRIWNIWLEPAPLIELPQDELLSRAQSFFDRGKQTFERKDVGAENRHKAWRDFRAAWLTLEAHPDPKPELYILAREKVKEAQAELNDKCADLMLEAESYFHQQNYPAAREALEHVHRYFPANDQTCPRQAEQKLAEWDL